MQKVIMSMVLKQSDTCQACFGWSRFSMIFTYSFRSPCVYHQGRRIPSWVKLRCSQILMLHELTNVHIFGVVKVQYECRCEHKDPGT